jgi:protein-S-isoprenylcysteine O-methyltransferase Ste14
MTQAEDVAERTPFMIASGNFFFRWRDMLFPLVFAVLAIVLMPQYPFGSARADAWLDAAGIAIAVLGQSLRVAVIGYAYVKRGGKNKKVYADTLVQEGFFNHCRNPLYVGNILILLGLIVVHNNLWFYVIGGAFYAFAYMAITLAEENFLRGKFGTQYEDYCRRVGRFLPSFRGLGRSLEGMHFDWRRVVRKEYGSTFTWLLTLLFLLIWERIRHGGYEAHTDSIRIIGLLVVPLALLYVLARVMKKTRLLGAD